MRVFKGPDQIGVKISFKCSELRIKTVLTAVHGHGRRLPAVRGEFAGEVVGRPGGDGSRVSQAG